MVDINEMIDNINQYPISIQPGKTTLITDNFDENSTLTNIQEIKIRI